MLKSPSLRLLAAAGAALLAGAGLANAQSVAPPGSRLVAVPPGAVVFVLPGIMAPAAFSPFIGFRDPADMLQDVDAMMAEAQRSLALPVPGMAIDAGFAPGAEGRALPPGVTSVMVTTFSSGQGSCTRQVTTTGTGAAPKVDIRMTGNACPTDATQAAAPVAPATPRPAVRTLQVERSHPRPYQLAQAD